MVAETGTAATKSCSDENLWKSITPNQNQLLILHLSAIILLLDKTNSYSISNYIKQIYLRMEVLTVRY
jgi:hypothetical protein